VARRVPLKDRLFSAFCLVGAVAVLVLGVSRGNPRAGLIGAGILIGYAVLQAVSRRLTPGARLLTGVEADERERTAQLLATRSAGLAAIGVAAIGVLLSLVWDWSTGLWVAGATMLVVVSFVASLWWHARAPS